MTITYNIPQCKREFTAYFERMNELENGHISTRPAWQGIYQHNMQRWAERLVKATRQAVDLNREIIAYWTTTDLLTVTRQNHNPYMTVAALELLSEDMDDLDDDELGQALVFAQPLRGLGICDVHWFIKTFEGELEYRRDLAAAPTDNESPAESAGWKQSDYL